MTLINTCNCKRVNALSLTVAEPLNFLFWIRIGVLTPKPFHRVFNSMSSAKEVAALLCSFDDLATLVGNMR